MASDSTASRILVFDTQSPQTTLLSVNMSGVTKLNENNYLMWTRQVKALLEGHGLHHFLSDSTARPSPTIRQNDTTVPNPAFEAWNRQDLLLYSSVIGTISLPLQSVVSTATTTKEVWDLLAQTFDNPTRGHIRQLQMQIRACSKGTQTIAEYLSVIKAKSDDLALLGKPMDPEDLIGQILAGLGDEYKPEIDAIIGRDEPISFEELHERLVNREAMIMCSEKNTIGPVVANASDEISEQLDSALSTRCYEKEVISLLSEIAKQQRSNEQKVGHESLENTRNLVAVVSVFISSVAYAGGINPPGGVYQDGPLRGKSVVAKTNAFVVFATFNNLALFTSLLTAIVLVSLLPLKSKPLKKLLVLAKILMWISVVSMAIAFMAAYWVVIPYDNETRWVLAVMIVVAVALLTTISLYLLFGISLHRSKKNNP